MTKQSDLKGANYVMLSAFESITTKDMGASFTSSIKVRMVVAHASVHETAIKVTPWLR